MHQHHELEDPRTAPIPPSFELFYVTTVIRTLSAALRLTAERDIALRATQHTYAIMLARWCDRHSQPIRENARFAVALATRTAAAFFRHLDNVIGASSAVTTPERSRCGEFSDWFDVREGLRELASGVHVPQHPDADPALTALVVSDDPFLRRCMAERLTQLGAVTFHHAATVAEARKHAGQIPPCHLAVLDLELTGGCVLELVTYLHHSGYRWILVLAPPSNPSIVPMAFQAGAQACLVKSAAPMNFERLRIPDHGTTPTPIHPYRYRLSTREIEVLRLVAAGHSNKEIGQELKLSALTIRSHLSRIGRKMATGDRAQMVALAMRAGIIH